jgi:hypothetical protein
MFKIDIQVFLYEKNSKSLNCFFLIKNRAKITLSIMSNDNEGLHTVEDSTIRSGASSFKRSPPAVVSVKDLMSDVEQSQPIDQVTVSEHIYRFECLSIRIETNIHLVFYFNN